MEYGVYSKIDYELAISEVFSLVFYKYADTFGTKLYRYKKLIAVCEHASTNKVTGYAFVNNNNENIFNNEYLCSILGEDLVISGEVELFKKDEINIVPADTYMPTVSEKGIAYCLKNWKLGNKLDIFGDALNFTMNTGKIEYVMMIRKPNDDIYCGASVTIPYDNGLFGGQQYFRIRNYAGNSQPWCKFHCNLGNKVVIPDFKVPKCTTGSCILTNDGYFWEVKRSTDNEIVLQGCGDDEYFYSRDAHMMERFR